MNNNEKGFEVEVDASRRLITITARGFWDAEVIANFQAAVQTAKTLLSGMGAICVLVDARDFAVQSQESIGHFGNLSSGFSPGMDRIAVVTSAALVRMQVGRIDGAERQRRDFVTPQDALHWLFAEIPETT